MKKLTAAMIGLTLCATAQAEFYSGNDVYQKFSDPDPFVRGISMGFVIGVFDVGQRAWHCAPGTVTAGQVRDLAKTYLENNPAIRHQPAEKLLRDLYRAAWPCQNTNRNNL